MRNMIINHCTLIYIIIFVFFQFNKKNNFSFKEQVSIEYSILNPLRINTKFDKRKERINLKYQYISIAN